MLGRVTVTLISLLLTGGAGYYVYDQQEPICDISHRPIHQATAYSITFESGEVVEACCARCGLHYQEEGTGVVAVEVADFTSGEMIDAYEAVYVEDSSLNLCLSEDVRHRDATGGQYELAYDRCMPSLIGFRTRKDAITFVHANGGAIRSYDQLLDEVYN